MSSTTLSTQPDVLNRPPEPVNFEASFSLLWLLIAAATALYTSATVLPFFVDLIDKGTVPKAIVVASGLGLIGLLGWFGWETWRNWRRKARFDLEIGGVIIVGLAFLTTFSYSLNQAAPFDNLPVGITADSTHHFALSDYIELHHALPTRAGPTDRARLVEMVSYPPAYHLSAALVSQATHTDLAYTIFPLAAFFMALCTAATAALAYTLLQPTFLRPFLALLSAYLAYLAYGFCFDTFMYWDFYGQLAGQAALALGLYFALHYYRSRYWPSLLMGGLAGSVLVLAYTHWLPIVGFGLVGAIVARPGLFWRVRLVLAGLTGLGLSAMLGLFLKDRLGEAIVWSGGAGADISINETGLGWLVFSVAGLGGLIWLGNSLLRRYKIIVRYSSWLRLGYGLIAVGAGGFVLFQVGSDLAKVSPPHLYPFDNLAIWLPFAAGLGALVALFGKRPAGRFYLFLVAGLVLEIAGYLLIKPGGSANAYHLSKLFTIGFVIILPPLTGLLLQAVLVDGPAWMAHRLKPDQPPAPYLFRWTVSLAGLVLAGLISFMAYNLLLSHSPDRPRVAVDSSIVRITERMRAGEIDLSKIELSVRAGIPAYFTYVGLLGQPRNNTALDYYTGSRHSFEPWLYNPQSQQYFLTDEYDAILRDHPGETRFRALYTQGDKVALLTHTPGYLEELINRRALFLKFQAQLEVGVLTVNIDVAGEKSALQGLIPVLAIGPFQDNTAPLLTKPVVKRELPLDQLKEAYSYQQGYLKWRFTDGYSRGEMNDQPLQPTPFKLGNGKYSVWVQWWKDGQPMTQRKVQDFELVGDRQVPLSPGEGEAAQAERTGQILLEVPDAVPPTLTDANTFFQQGEQKLLEITGWETSPTTQAGQTLQVWQRYLPVANLPTDYIVFVHLLNEQGAVVAQSDFEPAQGVYPTWLWSTNQPVVFTQAVKLPASLSPGKYSLEIGIYSDPGQKRLETWFYEPYLNRIWENRFYVKDAVTIM